MERKNCFSLHVDKTNLRTLTLTLGFLSSWWNINKKVWIRKKIIETCSFGKKSFFLQKSWLVFRFSFLSYRESFYFWELLLRLWRFWKDWLLLEALKDLQRNWSENRLEWGKVLKNPSFISFLFAALISSLILSVQRSSQSRKTACLRFPK